MLVYIVYNSLLTGRDEAIQDMSAEQADGLEVPDRDLASPDKALQSKKLQKLQKAYERKGIIYVSRIPPHMVRQWL